MDASNIRHGVRTAARAVPKRPWTTLTLIQVAGHLSFWVGDGWGMDVTWLVDVFG